MLGYSNQFVLSALGDQRHHLMWNMTWLIAFKASFMFLVGVAAVQTVLSLILVELKQGGPIVVCETTTLH